MLRHLPNAITISRIAVTPAITYSVITHQHDLALALFSYAALSDAADGWLARRFNATSLLGSYLDPVADKWLVGNLVGALCYTGQMPLWMGGIVLARDTALVAGALIIKSSTDAKFEIKPSNISKFNTFMQFAYITGSIMLPSIGIPDAQSLEVLGYAMSTTTVWSGIDYAYKMKGMKRISQ